MRMIRMSKILMGLASLYIALVVGPSARAEIVGDVLTYSHQGTALEGYLAYDNALKGPLPAVLLVHEWWGHNAYIEKRAKDYAALGYVAFALDMYGKGVTTSSPEEATKLSKPFYEDRNFFRSRLKAGLDQLLAQKFVNQKRVAVLGYCFGGTGALELARSGADVVGAISFHGGLATPLPANEAGQIKGKVLVLNGAEDPMVKPEERAQFMDEMRKAGADWQFVEFGGAVHAFTNPGTDAFKIPGVGYNAAADRRSFAMSREFLREVLGG